MSGIGAGGKVPGVTGLWSRSKALHMPTSDCGQKIKFQFQHTATALSWKLRVQEVINQLVHNWLINENSMR